MFIIGAYVSRRMRITRWVASGYATQSIIAAVSAVIACGEAIMLISILSLAVALAGIMIQGVYTWRMQSNWQFVWHLMNHLNQTLFLVLVFVVGISFAVVSVYVLWHEIKQWIFS